MWSRTSSSNADDSPARTRATSAGSGASSSSPTPFLHPGISWPRGQGSYGITSGTRRPLAPRSAACSRAGPRLRGYREGAPFIERRGGGFRAPAAAEPLREGIEVGVDDRGDVERDELGEGQSAHDGESEWTPGFGPGAEPDRDRERAHEGGHGGHHDRAEADPAGLDDRVA